MAALCLLLLLVGCGLFTSKQTRALRRTPQYKVGYQDGCRSAGSPDANMREPAPQVRDDHLYETDKAYRLGWGTGYGACRSFTPRNAAPSPDRGPIPDPTPGNGGVP
jgi:hypothetical protein